MNLRNIVDEILYKADITEIIGEDVSLKKRGARYVALCPFHNEKTPSFTVSREKGLYYCFGCGEGGNIFTYLTKKHNYSFKEAVLMLADRYGLEVPSNLIEGTSSDNTMRKICLEINNMALRFFIDNLWSKNGHNALNYLLNNRRLSKEIVKNAKIGYAFPVGNALTNHLISKGFNETHILNSGIAFKGKDGNLYDIFRNRITFPIFDLRDRVIGFGGRILNISEDKKTSSDEPKYLNSYDTIVFKKGQIFFGLPKGLEECQRKGFVIIVEGYMDLLSLWQAGFQNTLSTIGTAITEYHTRFLKRFTDDVRIMFDSDEGGRKAMWRALELFIKEDTIPKGIILPEGEDPDEFIIENGVEKTESLIRNARSVIELYTDFLSKTDDGEIRKKRVLVGQLLSLISKINSEIEKDYYLDYISSAFNLKKVTILKEMDNQKEKIGNNTTDNKNKRENTKIEKIEEAFLKYIHRSPLNINNVDEPLLFLLSEPIKKIVTKAIEIGKFDEDVCINVLNESGIDPSPYINILFQKDKEKTKSGDEIKESNEINFYKRKLYERFLKKKRDEFKSILSKPNPKETEDRILKMIERISRELKNNNKEAINYGFIKELQG